jgi:hypothetical protein
MRVEYPISTKYVSHWGIWEALREIFQNALDSDANVKTDYTYGTLTISNEGSIDRCNLLLGITNKGDIDRGKFGEGLKLAMLVLAREGRLIRVHTGTERWTPLIVESEVFQQYVLATDIEPEVSDRVIVQIEVRADEYKMFTERCISLPYGVIDKPKGEIYVGGLYVCTMKNMDKAYNFSPTDIRLNRDRDIPSMFDIQWATPKYLTGDDIIATTLAGKNDVSGYNMTPHKIAESWIKKYPNVVPVGIEEQDTIHTDSAIKIVPDWLARTIRSVKDFVLSFKASPAERLDKWIKQNSYRLDAVALSELQQIQKDLK